LVRLEVMKPYSNDLRERVIAALEAGQESQREIAETFAVSLSTVEKWWRCWCETGRRTAFPHAGGARRALQGCAAFICAEVKKQPDVTLAELCARVAETKGVQASPSMMCRELQRLRLPRKKSPSTTANGIHRGSRDCGKRLPSGCERPSV
jgi:transposase